MIVYCPQQAQRGDDCQDYAIRPVERLEPEKPDTKKHDAPGGYKTAASAIPQGYHACLP